MEEKKNKNATRIYNKSDNEDYYVKRDIAQRISFAKIQELLQRNVKKTTNKSFTQYSKELLRNYIQSPVNNQDNIREVSRFLCRYSMLYKKLLMYYASMPLFYYNITQINDFTKTMNKNKTMKNYQKVLSEFEKVKLKKEGYTALYLALRDGFYVGYVYDNDNSGRFFMPLDVKYCRIYGKNAEGEWIVYFDASYFDSGNNKEFVQGIDGDESGIWDDVFVEGYEMYKEKGRDYQWFRLTPEKTMCITTCDEDEFYSPLPFFLPLFELILDDIDLQELINNRAELENYILLISKIPMIKNSESVDDFALSIELAQDMQQLIDEAVPELIGTAMSPMEIEKIEFPRSNSTQANDDLAKSVNNIFNNAGVSQIVVAGGASTNSVGLKHAIENDMAVCWTWIDKIQSWMNYYIKSNISDGYYFKIHKITWYNTDEYQSSMKDAATLGGSALDYLTSLGDTPYIAINKLMFENLIGIKEIMIPLKSSYTMTNNSKSDTNGRPEMNEDDLSEEGLDTKESGKNDGTKANNA